MSQPLYLLNPTLLRVVQNWVFLKTDDLKDSVALSFDCPDCQHTNHSHRIICWRCRITPDGYRFHGHELSSLSLVPYTIRSPHCKWKGTLSFGIIVNLP